jgi:predicted negative regulator of RcsB-dependent stress response
MVTAIIIALLLILCGTLGYHLWKQRQQDTPQEELSEELLNIPQDMVKLMDAASKLLDVIQLNASNYTNEMGVIEDIMLELRSWNLSTIDYLITNKVESQLINYRVTLEEIDEALTIMNGKVGN